MDRRQFSIGTIGLLTTAGTLLARDPESQETFTVGVIGHTGRGNYGHGLDTVWQHLDQASIVAAADANEAGLQKACKKLKLDETAGFSDYHLMLSEVHPDIVAVCPRHLDQHHDMITAAIEAGVKGIYVEKPFVRTPDEADRVVELCEKHGVKLAVAHRNRYHPALLQIDQLLKEGHLGRLLEIRGRGKGDRRGGAEDLWVLGSHVLNLISYFGGVPQTCSAMILQDGQHMTRDDIHEGAEGLGPLAGNELHARFEFDSGIFGYFDSIANDGTDNFGFGLRLIGSKGTINIRCDETPLAHLMPGNPFEPVEAPQRWLPISTGGVDVPEPNPDLVIQVQQHITAAQDLIDSLKSKERQPLCDAIAGAATVEMISAVFESHRQGGKAVTLPLLERGHPLKRF